MPDSSTLLVFGLAALALLVVPGPSVLYIVTRSMDQGRAAGVVSVLGIHTGTLVHIAAAVVGISALILSSALAFSVVKYAGAAYLVYVGIRRLLTKEQVEEIGVLQTRKLSRIYSEGVLVNTLNPKTALFFLAFLPQFVDTSEGSAALQVLLLGFMFIGLGLVSDGLYALLGSSLGAVLRGSRRWAQIQRFFAGGVFTTLGLSAAFAGRPSS